MGSAEAGQQKGYGLYLYRIMKIPGRYLLSEESGYLFFGAPGGARFSRVQVPNPPGSGKDIAEGKGVHREVESEGSRIWENY